MPEPSGNWHRVASEADLSGRDRLVVRFGPRQIVLFRNARGLHACNNRCPHEGYPLAEGTITEDCVLTCNWHNWKFDLRSGLTLVGGDLLRSYPVEIRDGEVFLEITEPDPGERARTLYAALETAFREHDYTRMARELARLQQVGESGLRAFTRALVWAHDHLEFGTTHAHAASADWLRLAAVVERPRFRGSSTDPMAEVAMAEPAAPLAVTDPTAAVSTADAGAPLAADAGAALAADAGAALPGDAAAALVPYLEAIGHLAWDSLRHPVFAYATRSIPFDADGFARAIEQEDEKTAIAMVRGALDAEVIRRAATREEGSVPSAESAGKEPDPLGSLWIALARAALAHYNDFGHSAIYVYKNSQTMARLESEVPDLERPAREAILLPLVRSIIYASREDKIPEFRAYPLALKEWNAYESRDDSGKRNGGARDPINGSRDEIGARRANGVLLAAAPEIEWDPRHPRAEHFIGTSIREALDRCLAVRHAQGDSFDPLTLYDALLGAAAWNLLHFDTRWSIRTDQSVAHNVDWLDFTHALTFANAVRALASRDATLWPAGLLQMACFVGRVRNYVCEDDGSDPTRWVVAHPAHFFEEQTARLLDHGVGEYIISSHLLKTLCAVRAEVEARPTAPWVSVAVAATNRFLHARIKRRNSLRTARQALGFVNRE